MTNQILGYDIDRQPLRAGDRVVYAGEQPPPSFVPNGPYTVRGPARREACVVFQEKDLDGDVFGGECRSLRKLPPKQDHEPGSWEEIAKLGWKPEGVEA